MKILLLSAYDAVSHQHWRRGLVLAFPDYQWEVLVLPARYFSWRIRGNSLSWAYGQREVLEQPYDLIVATSMVDLATLKGLVPSLAVTPGIVYFHENQFAYPANERQHNSLEPAMVNLYSALAAGRIVFNSEYNRSSFMSGVSQLLKKLPDFVPEGIVEQLQQRSQLLPVPIEMECFQENQPDSSSPLHIVWNHRWEYDKGPDRLLRLVKLLLAQNQPFSLSVLGEQFRERPEQFDEIKQAFSRQSSAVLKHFGYIESISAYRKILASADVVLSTALHDFQGLAVLEAVAAACIPLLPARLCYGEWFDDDFCYRSLVDDADREAESLAERVIALAVAKKSASLPNPPILGGLGWDGLKPAYRRLLSEVVAQAGSLYDSRPQ
jgi:glycosyltransferase involved in cell wall biosynthesis